MQLKGRMFAEYNKISPFRSFNKAPLSYVSYSPMSVDVSRPIMQRLGGERVWITA